MEEIVKITLVDGNKLNARDLHRELGINTRFNDWIARRITEYGFEEGVDFYSTLSKTSQSGGRPTIEYDITVDMAKELCMLEKTPIGRQVRKYFIERDKKLTAIENDVRKQINNGAIHGAYGKEFQKYPHAYVDELMYKNSILGGKEAYQLAEIIYECGIEEGKK